MRTLRRVRAHLGMLALLAALSLVAGFLATAAPRVMNRLQDDALRRTIAGSAASVRDVSVVTDLSELTHPEDIPAELEQLRGRFPGAIRGAVSERWYSVQATPGAAKAEYLPEYEGLPPQIDVRTQSDLESAVRVVAGRLPYSPAAPPSGPGPVPMTGAVSRATAAALNLKVGSTFRVESPNVTPFHLKLRISGIFQPKDPKAPIWQDHPRSVRPAVPSAAKRQPYQGTVLVHLGAAASLQAAGWPAEVAWRYRLDERQVHAGEAEPMLAGLRTLGAGGHEVPGGQLRTGLDHLLQEHLAQRRAVDAVLAVVYAGLLGAMAGVLLLASRLAGDQRRHELGMWRARGASLFTVAGRVLADATVTAGPALLAGGALALAVPARSAGVPWLGIAVAVLAIGALPAHAVWSQRRIGVVASRQEAALLRPSLRRLTLEASCVLLAVAGVVLLRRRGLLQDSGVDPYLSALPLLLGAAAALLGFGCTRGRYGLPAASRRAGAGWSACWGWRGPYARRPLPRCRWRCWSSRSPSGCSAAWCAAPWTRVGTAPRGRRSARTSGCKGWRSDGTQRNAWPRPPGYGRRPR